jgi:hypothetical protein
VPLRWAGSLPPRQLPSLSDYILVPRPSWSRALRPCALRHRPGARHTPPPPGPRASTDACIVSTHALSASPDHDGCRVNRPSPRINRLTLKTPSFSPSHYHVLSQVGVIRQHLGLPAHTCSPPSPLQQPHVPDLPQRLPRGCHPCPGPSPGARGPLDLERNPHTRQRPRCARCAPTGPWLFRTEQSLPLSTRPRVVIADIARTTPTTVLAMSQAFATVIAPLSMAPATRIKAARYWSSCLTWALARSALAQLLPMPRDVLLAMLWDFTAMSASKSTLKAMVDAVVARHRAGRLPSPVSGVLPPRLVSGPPARPATPAQAGRHPRHVCGPPPLQAEESGRIPQQDGDVYPHHRLHAPRGGRAC